jgi:methylated-DNA-[protein]-cysteine S-methyltransferase
MRYCYYQSPVGPLLLAGDDAAVYRIGFGGTPERDWIASPARGVLADAAKQLREYFAGRRREFDLDLAPVGTPFQLRVWQCLRQIPYGETISYAELAKWSGNPKAARAVGSANGRNPLSIVVPCHRVIAADGTLGGFGGGSGVGLDVKQALLAVERSA